MCNQNQAIGILKEVFLACLPIYGESICHAYLYGSYARGDYTENSDVDIMLVVDTSGSMISKNRTAIASVTSELSLKHSVTVSVTVKPLEQFNKYSDILPFYKNVINEGIPYAI